MRTTKKITAGYVEFWFKRFWVDNVVIHSVEFEGSLRRFPVDPKHPGPKYLAEYWGSAEFNNRIYDVHCFITVDSFEEAEGIDDPFLTRRLEDAEWEQEVEFFGWWFEVKDLWRRWKWQYFGHEVTT